MKQEKILSKKDIADIRRKLKTPCESCGKKPTQHELAVEYGVSDALISQLVNRKKYFR